jgi:hypothetical protein
MSEPVFRNLGMYIMAPEPISPVYYMNPSHQSVCLCVSLIVARQRLGKNVTRQTNTHAVRFVSKESRRFVLSRASCYCYR